MLEFSSQEKDELNKNTKNFEIAFSQCLSRHNISPSAADCVVKIIKKYVTDSEIIKKISLGREKIRYITEYGISEVYEEETISKPKSCDDFGVAIDESEVNKKSEMEIMVRLATSELGLESRHYKSVDLEAGDAGTITETLLDTFTEDGVDYKAKMISVDMDGCNTMQGKKTGKFNLSFSLIVYLFYITGVITRLRA